MEASKKIQGGVFSIWTYSNIQTLSHTSYHYTTQQSFDPSCMMEGLGEIQAAHPGCHTGLMW